MRHTVIKVLKERERVSKVARGKRHVTYKEATIRLTADFLLEITEARRQCNDILSALKQKNYQRWP